MLLDFTFICEIKTNKHAMENTMNLIRARIFTSAIFRFIYQLFGHSHLFLAKQLAELYEHNRNIHLIPKAWSEHGVEALWTGQKNIL